MDTEWDAGLLARPAPSRKELMRAAGLYGKQADAVLALYADQPTEAETTTAECPE